MCCECSPSKTLYYSCKPILEIEPTDSKIQRWTKICVGTITYGLIALVALIETAVRSVIYVITCRNYGHPAISKQVIISSRHTIQAYFSQAPERHVKCAPQILSPISPLPDRELPPVILAQTPPPTPPPPSMFKRNTTLIKSLTLGTAALAALFFAPSLYRRLNTYVRSYSDPLYCAMYWGEPQDVWESRKIFQCFHPHSSIENSKLLGKVYRNASRIAHSDKHALGDKPFVILSKAYHLAKWAFTEEGINAAKVSSCIDALPFPHIRLPDVQFFRCPTFNYFLDPARKIYRCVNPGMDLSCEATQWYFKTHYELVRRVRILTSHKLYASLWALRRCCTSGGESLLLAVFPQSLRKA